MPELDTRSRIIATASRLFWEKGYGSTSIADILEAAGVNSGSLYHFFPGKQELLVAVLDDHRSAIWDMLLIPAWMNLSDPLEAVFALLDRYRAAILATDFTYGCPIGSLALEIHEPDPPVRERLAVNFDGWVDAVEGCLDESRHRLPSRTDRHQLALFVLTTMEGGVMLARTHRSIEPFDACVSQLHDYFDLLLDRRASRRRK